MSLNARRTATVAAAVAVAALGAPADHSVIASGAAVSTTTTNADPAVTAIPRPRHVVVVIFENKSRGQVLRHAPYFRVLARHGANLTRSHAVTHPSQPNYLALFSGGRHGVHDDGCPHRFDAPNLAHQLVAHGFTFGAYSEDLPHRGSLACQSSNGLYARKHAPWTNFTNVPRRQSVPYSRFPTTYGRLPTVSFVIPNLCHDMHDCGLRVGSRWLRHELSDYVRWARGHHSLLVVTFDEDDDSHANHIFTAIAGAGVTPGHYAQPVTHYSVLRTLEDMYGLAPLGHARRAHPIRAIWH